MIEFYGELSEACQVEYAKRRARQSGVFFLIVSIIISAISLVVGWYRNTLLYVFILMAILLAVTVVAFIPFTKRATQFRVTTRLTVGDGNVSFTQEVAGIQSPSRTKPVSKIKKIIDTGNQYYVIFRFGDIGTAWICEKISIRQGTVEAFEELFREKIVRKPAIA